MQIRRLDIMIYKVNFKKSFKLKFFLRLIVIMVVTGFSSIAFTASSGNVRSQTQTADLSYFDPFELETIFVSLANNEMNTAVTGNPGGIVVPSVYASSNLLTSGIQDELISRPPVRVPYRPPFRSPFRPPWVPGPPSWYPGNPPWAP
jgi:hypothetical protein